MGGKIEPICQETQVEESAARDDKTCRNNDQKKIMKVNRNVKWRAQDKINIKQKSVVQKKDIFNGTINKYIQKNDDQKRKLLILREEGIEN